MFQHMYIGDFDPASLPGTVAELKGTADIFLLISSKFDILNAL